MSASTESGRITVFRGDATDAFGLRTITINITGDIDLTHAVARFSLHNFTKVWTNAETKTGSVTLVMDSLDTRSMPVGDCFGKLMLYDVDGIGADDIGRRLTVVNTIPFTVTDTVVGVPAEEFDINVTLSVDTEINIQFVSESPGEGDCEWELDGEILRPADEDVERIVVPALADVTPLGSRYTVADVAAKVNAILAALKE